MSCVHFNDFGLLDPREHLWNRQEVWQNLHFSPRRAELLNLFNDVVDHTEASGLWNHILLDDTFVTQKDDPEFLYVGFRCSAAYPLSKYGDEAQKLRNRFPSVRFFFEYKGCAMPLSVQFSHVPEDIFPEIAQISQSQSNPFQKGWVRVDLEVA